MGVFQERFIGVFARDAYYQKKRVITPNDAEWDVASVYVTADTTRWICKHSLDGFRVGLLLNLESRDSSVGIATRYGLDGPGIESRWGGSEIFRTRPDRPWSPPSLIYYGYRVFPGRVKRPGRGVDRLHPI